VDSDESSLSPERPYSRLAFLILKWVQKGRMSNTIGQNVRSSLLFLQSSVTTGGLAQTLQKRGLHQPAIHLPQDKGRRRFVLIETPAQGVLRIAVALLVASEMLFIGFVLFAAGYRIIGEWRSVGAALAGCGVLWILSGPAMFVAGCWDLG
jgi:hypothetical protein